MFGTAAASGIFKEGTKHLSGVDEAVIRNIEAVKDFMAIVRTSLGPNGMNKMVINHLGKIFVTHDASTIVRELEVQHPAAKMLVLAADAQQKEVGDATNLVIAFGGELLAQSEGLLRMGLHTADIIDGYAKAARKAAELLQTEFTGLVPDCDVSSHASVTAALRSVIAAKQHGFEDILAPLVAHACIHALNRKNSSNFNVDNVRVAKIEGASVASCQFVPGFVLTRPVQGTVHKVSGAKIAVFNCALDHSSTETKGTVMLRSADELKAFSGEEEKILGEAIGAVAAAGVNVVVCGQNISELAMHFIERHGMMAIKVPSKFDLRRVCTTTGATALVRLGAPTADEIGHAEVVEEMEIAGTKVTLIRTVDTTGEGGVGTLIVRGATGNIMDDVERAIDKATNTFKVLCRNPKLVPGGGATEMHLALLVQRFGDAAPGLDQYAIKKFAEALEMVPRTLAENAGANATELISSLYAQHAAHEKESAGKCACVDVMGMTLGDAMQMQVFDALESKVSAFQLAINAALDVLRVDSIIMARPAGGPKPPGK